MKNREECPDLEERAKSVSNKRKKAKKRSKRSKKTKKENKPRDEAETAPEHTQGPRIEQKSTIKTEPRADLLKTGSHESRAKVGLEESRLTEKDFQKFLEMQKSLETAKNRFSTNLDQAKIEDLRLKQMGEQFIRKGTSPGLEIMLDVLGITSGARKSSLLKQGANERASASSDLISSLIQKFDSMQKSLKQIQKQNQEILSKRSLESGATNGTSFNNTFEKKIRESYVGDRVSFDLNKLIFQGGDKKSIFFKRGTLVVQSPDKDYNEKLRQNKAAVKNVIPEESLEAGEVFEGGLNEEQLRENNIFLLFNRSSKSDEADEDDKKASRNKNPFLVSGDQEEHLRAAEQIAPRNRNLFSSKKTQEEQMPKEESPGRLAEKSRAQPEKGQDGEKQDIIRRSKFSKHSDDEIDSLEKSVNLMTSQMTICLKEASQLESELYGNEKNSDSDEDEAVGAPKIRSKTMSAVTRKSSPLSRHSPSS